MKKRIITALTVLAGFAGLQQVNAQTTFGLRAGVNFQNITGDNAAGGNLEYKLKTGFNVGLNAEIPVAPDYFIQPGVLLTTKGANTDPGKISLSYIDIPVNFIYKPVLGSGKMLLGFGPYVGFGIGGKTEDGSGNEYDIEFENENTVPNNRVFKRMDAGANFLAGYEFSNKLSFQLNAQLGLAKINPEFTTFPNDEANYKNTGFGLSLGYRF